MTLAPSALKICHFLLEEQVYTLKTLKLDILHFKRSVKMLKSVKLELLHLKGTLHSQIP